MSENDTQATVTPDPKLVGTAVEAILPSATGLTYGEALIALKQGKRIARSGWNGKGLFIFMQVPSDVPSEVVPQMSSLPQSVKDEFERRGGPSISYRNQIAMVYPDNTIYGWVASPSDCLEEDWTVLD